MSNMDERTISKEIDHNDAGKRLDNCLTERFKYRSRNQWQNMIREGLMLLNGKKTKNSRKLKSGDIISLISTRPEPAVDFTYSIEYEDDDLLIVNKCGDLPVHPAGPFFKNTLWHHMKAIYGDIFIVNRLDRETSGLMIVAKNKSAAAKCCRFIEEDKVEKKYYAFVYGSFTKNFHAKGYLVNDEESEVRKKRKFIQGSKAKNMERAEYAETIFKPVRSSDEISIVECTLKTGRFHQIRATLFSLGFPLVGDKLYGLDDTIYLRLPQNAISDVDWQKLIINHQALHAYHLAFPHPVTGTKLNIEIELPEEMNFDTIKAKAINGNLKLHYPSIAID